jgi:DNA-binding response OmpR family regulator
VPRRGAATILVLEAKAAVLELVDQELREAGYRVVLTMDGHEAVEVVRSVRVDLVVVGTAQGGRQAFVDELRAVQPCVPIVRIRDGDAWTVDCVAELARPFSLDELRRAIARLLEEQEGRAA